MLNVYFIFMTRLEDSWAKTDLRVLLKKGETLMVLPNNGRIRWHPLNILTFGCFSYGYKLGRYDRH